MPTITRGSHHIAYQVQGKGEPLVMLRGLGRTMRHWLGYDRKVADNHQVITLDLRGIGQTTSPLSFFHTMHDLADDVVAVLDELGIMRAHILGVSLGGMVALATGIKYPGRCKSIITINTSIAGQRSLRISARGVWAIASGLIGEKSKLHHNLADILTAGQQTAARRAKIAKEFIKIADEEGLYTVTTIKQLILASRFSVKNRLAELKMPVLLVYGEDDRFVPNINTRKLTSHLRNARLLAIPEAGHEVMHDQPNALHDAITLWTREHQTPSATRSTKKPTRKRTR